MDRGAWWATVHGVAKSQTRLSDWALRMMTRLTFLPYTAIKHRKTEHDITPNTREIKQVSPTSAWLSSWKQFQSHRVSRQKSEFWVFSSPSCWVVKTKSRKTREQRFVRQNTATEELAQGKIKETSAEGFLPAWLHTELCICEWKLAPGRERSSRTL